MTKDPVPGIDRNLFVVCVIAAKNSHYYHYYFHYYLTADTEKVGKQKFPILVVESIGEQTNEILVRENEDLDAKIAKESLLAENVFDETDIKAKCEFCYKLQLTENIGAIDRNTVPMFGDERPTFMSGMSPY